MDGAPESTGVTPPKTGPRLGCGVTILAVLGVCIALYAWGTIRGNQGPDIGIHGMITINQRANMFTSGSSCAGRGDFENVIEGEFVTVRPEDRSPEVFEIRSGMIVNGECVLRFSGTVKEADTYEFRISGLPPLVVRHSLVDVLNSDGEPFLDIKLSWD